MPPIPAIPAMRPCHHISTAAAVPMSAPPARDEKGVKLFQSIVMRQWGRKGPMRWSRRSAALSTLAGRCRRRR